MEQNTETTWTVGGFSVGDAGLTARPAVFNTETGKFYDPDGEGPHYFQGTEGGWKRAQELADRLNRAA